MYQVYVPSPRTLSQTSLVSHPSLSAQHSYSNGLPSYSATGGGGAASFSTGQTSLRSGSGGYPSLQPAAATPFGRSNLQVYSQLQLPSTSNWGSMKRGAKRARENSAAANGSGGPASFAVVGENGGMTSPASLPDLNPEAPYSVQYTPHVLPLHNNNKPTKV